jgi:hypothetical protein
MRTVGLLLTVVGTPVLAQVRMATMDELRRELSPCDAISVVQTTGDSVGGLLFGASDLDVCTETQAAEGQQRRRIDITVPLSTVRPLERLRDSSRTGTLIGAVIGTGVGLAMFIHAAAVGYDEIDESGPIYVGIGGGCTGIGALTGWAIDTAHSKPHIRFDAPSNRSTEFRVTALRGRG